MSLSRDISLSSVDVVDVLSPEHHPERSLPPLPACCQLGSARPPSPVQIQPAQAARKADRTTLPQLPTWPEALPPCGDGGPPSPPRAVPSQDASFSQDASYWEERRRPPRDQARAPSPVRPFGLLRPSDGQAPGERPPSPPRLAQQVAQPASSSALSGEGCNADEMASPGAMHDVDTSPHQASVASTEGTPQSNPAGPSKFRNPQGPQAPAPATVRAAQGPPAAEEAPGGCQGASEQLFERINRSPA